MKTVYLLVGPKGAGKSYIGGVLERRTGVHFLAIEPLILREATRRGYPPGQPVTDAYDVVLNALADILAEKDAAIIETTGVGPTFADFLATLREWYAVVFVKVHAPLDLALTRVEERNAAGHIPLDVDLIRRINTLAAAADYPYAAVIDNTHATEEEIVAAFRPALGQG